MRNKSRLLSLITALSLCGCGVAGTDTINSSKAPDTPASSTAGSSQDEDSPTKEVSWEDAYKPILNTYLDEYEKSTLDWNYAPDFDQFPEIPGVEGAVTEIEFYSSPGKIYCFLLDDLDGNGIPELFISKCLSIYGGYNIYHVFTYKDGSAIELLSNLGYRSGICTICENNELTVSTSGTATDYGTTLYYLPKNSTELQEIEQVWAMQNEKDMSLSDFFYLKEGGEKEQITEDDYKKRCEEYKAQNGLSYIPGTKENIDNIGAIWNGSYPKNASHTDISEESLEQQIKLIVKNKDLWKIRYEDGETISPHTYYYVTDYDHNGRLEINGAETAGSGIFTTLVSYEVNASCDNLNLVGRSGDAPEFFGSENIVCFFDSENMEYSYMAVNHSKSGAVWGTSEKDAIVLKNGLLQARFLASKHFEPENESSGDLVYTYTDSSGSEISEDEYNDAEERLYANCEKQTVSFGCLCNNSENVFELLPDETMTQLLLKSYEVFAGKISNDELDAFDEQIRGSSSFS